MIGHACSQSRCWPHPPGGSSKSSLLQSARTARTPGLGRTAASAHSTAAAVVNVGFMVTAGSMHNANWELKLWAEKGKSIDEYVKDATRM